ncbi:MAG: hypothetical protein WCR45_07120 [Bacteroidaceae bacterium]|nr:hypothetical protein [Bacteroidaceae bacterium]
MADNYLEDQFEKYQARKAAMEILRKQGKLRPKSSAQKTKESNTQKDKEK